MPTALAIALPGRPPSEPARADADPGRNRTFDRHLVVAGTGTADKAAHAAGKPTAKAQDDSPPATTPAARAKTTGADAAPAAAKECALPSEEHPDLETPAAVAATDVLALTAQGVVVLPPPIADPLANAPAPVALPVVVQALAATATDLPSDPFADAEMPPAAAPLLPAARTDTLATLDATLDAEVAAAHARPAQPEQVDNTVPSAGAMPTAAQAPAVDEAPTGSALGMLAALAAPTPAQPEAAPGDEADADPANGAQADIAGLAPSAPAVASQRPRNQAFERDTAAEVLPEVGSPKGAAASPGGASAPPSDPLAGVTSAQPERQPTTGRIDTAAPPPAQPGESARAPNAMDRAVAGQVSRAMLTRGANGERMLVLRLTPPELGTVRIEVIERAGVMTARIHAEDDAVRGALERSLPQMRQDLRAHDAPVRDVALADTWNGLANRQGRNDTSGGRQQRSRDDGAPAFSIDGAAPPIGPPSIAASLGGIANARGVDARA